MSYTTMFAAPESGPMYEVADFGSVLRSAYLVWDNLATRYLLGDSVVMRMVTGKMQPVWDLWKRNDIPLSHRIVMLMTFDKVVVKRENFERLAKAIDEYAISFDPGSLLEQADKLRELANDESVYAVCWNQTSVCQPHWQIEDGEDWYRMYDLSRDTDHWFLFDELDGLKR